MNAPMVKTSSVVRSLCGFLIALALLLTPSAAFPYTIDTATSPSPITGLWWNQNESGWGANFTEQYDVIFVTLYTYDATGNPIWYVASNCAVTGGGCQGDLYKVTGGSMPTVTWNGSNKVVTAVGTMNLAFTDNDTGTMNYMINGVSGSKAITRQVWRSAPPAGGPSPTLLITEVNSNAPGGDFFELYNFGAAAVDLTGWRWDDDSASFSEGGNVTFPSVSIPPGQRLVVVNTTDAATFRSAWGLASNVPVVAITGPGLGAGDAVVLFDTTGKVVTWFNYKGGAPIVASDGTLITPSAASPGVAASLPNHAGLAYGGDSALTSAVWDGVSTSAPSYRAAVVGVLGGFAQPGMPTAVGSPGR